MRSSATPRAAVEKPTAARCSARSAIRSTPTTSRRSCCRRRPRRPRSSGSPMPAATPSTRSSRAPSSASSRAARSSPACWCSRATSTRSGCTTAQGLTLTETWYWDLNDANRAWTKRWQAERRGGQVPDHGAGRRLCRRHALPQGAWSRSKSAADGKAVVAKMKEMPTDDPLFGKGTIRADGRKVHDAYLFEVKKPAESKYPGDFYTPARHHPGGGSVPSAQGRRLPAGRAADADFDRLTLSAGAASRRTQAAATRGTDLGNRVDWRLPHLRDAPRNGAPQDEGANRGTAYTHVRNLRHPIAGVVRPAPDRADQRLVLCAAQPRPRRHLRHAQHHQLRARRPIHDGRVRGLSAAATRSASATGRR